MSTLKNMISNYVNDCIDDRSSGFRTDFGIGKIVSTNVHYHINKMIVTIKDTKETIDFSIDEKNDIINWIYEKIK